MLHMNYSLKSLKGGYIGDYIRITSKATKGDTRSLDNGSNSYRNPVGFSNFTYTQATRFCSALRFLDHWHLRWHL